MLRRGLCIARGLVANVGVRATIPRVAVPTAFSGFDQWKKHAPCDKTYLRPSRNHLRALYFSTENDSVDESEDGKSETEEAEGERKKKYEYNKTEWRAKLKSEAKRQLDFLKKDVGLGTKIRKRARNLKSTTVKAMKVKIQFFRDELSITEKEFKRLFRKGGLGRVLHKEGEESVVERVKYLFNLFNNDKEVVRSVLLKCPAILTEPLGAKIKPKVDYLRTEVFAVDPTMLPLQLQKVPQLLLGSYPLEGYIKPEILALKNAGHDPALHLESLNQSTKETDDDGFDD